MAVGLDGVARSGDPELRSKGAISRSVHYNSIPLAVSGIHIRK